VIEAGFARLRGRSDRVIIEGAGGWLAPINARESMGDLARALGVPAVLVVALRLGCLNHAGLTRRAIAADGVPLAGWIANRLGAPMDHEAENLVTLARLLGAPPLAIVPFVPARAGSLTLEEAAATLAARTQMPGNLPLKRNSP
jgi:dethiobiotin synthetase